jgi:hypothetical protein
MTRVDLRVYVNPGHAEVYLRFDLANGSTQRVTATVNTGSRGTLLPENFLNRIEYHDPRRVWIEPEGLTAEAFEAIEADVFVRAEDEVGNQTAPFEIVIWFAGTYDFIAGFNGLLNAAILHLDMPNLSGYLEFHS